MSGTVLAKKYANTIDRPIDRPLHGSTEDLRHPMIEALITNFPAHAPQRESEEREQLAFFEKPVREYLDQEH